jgi:hypothetical protein
LARSDTRETDWIGQWFAFIKERGGNDLFTILQYNVRTGEKIYHDQSHIEMDAIGWLMKYLEQQGYQLDPPTLPGEEPGWGVLLKTFGAFRRMLRAQELPWRYTGSERRPAPHDYSFLVFTKEETRALLDYVRASRYSLAAYLFSRVHGVLGPRYLREDVPARWLLPLDLRGPVRRLDPYSNHSSGLPLICRFDTTPDDLRAQMRQGMKDNLHWWMWRALNIGKLIGARGARWLSSREQHRHTWMGTFSVMGEWPRRGAPPFPVQDEIIVGVPPGSTAYPIGVSAGTWNGYFAMTLKLHPMIEADREGANARLTEIRAVFQRDVAAGPRAAARKSPEKNGAEDS